MTRGDIVRVVFFVFLLCTDHMEVFASSTALNEKIQQISGALSPMDPSDTNQVENQISESQGHTETPPTTSLSTTADAVVEYSNASQPLQPAPPVGLVTDDKKEDEPFFDRFIYLLLVMFLTVAMFVWWWKFSARHWWFISLIGISFCAAFAGLIVEASYDGKDRVNVRKAMIGVGFTFIGVVVLYSGYIFSQEYDIGRARFCFWTFESGVAYIFTYDHKVYQVVTEGQGRTTLDQVGKSKAFILTMTTCAAATLTRAATNEIIPLKLIEHDTCSGSICTNADSVITERFPTLMHHLLKSPRPIALLTVGEKKVSSPPVLEMPLAQFYTEIPEQIVVRYVPLPRTPKDFEQAIIRFQTDPFCHRKSAPDFPTPNPNTKVNGVVGTSQCTPVECDSARNEIIVRYKCKDEELSLVHGPCRSMALDADSSCAITGVSSVNRCEEGFFPFSGGRLCCKGTLNKRPSGDEKMCDGTVTVCPHAQGCAAQDAVQRKALSMLSDRQKIALLHRGIDVNSPTFSKSPVALALIAKGCKAFGMEDGEDVCKCPKGKHISLETRKTLETVPEQCESCPEGMYHDGSGVDCLPCSYSMTHSPDFSACVCKPGFGKVTDPPESKICQECPIGWKKDKAGDVACESCPDGEIDEHRLKCVACPKGTYRWKAKGGACEECPFGYYRVPETQECKECLERQISKDGECKECPEGHHRNRLYKPGEPDEKPCTGCPAGQTTTVHIGTEIKYFSPYCIECGHNQVFLDDKRYCEYCPEGAFRVPGKIVCSDCPNGKIRFNPKSEYFSEKADTECHFCPEGFTPSAKRNKCDACPAGTHAVEGLCTDCPAGLVSIDGRKCISCSPGYEANPKEGKGTSCTATKPGYASRNFGEKDLDVEHPKPALTASKRTTPAVRALPCAAGYYQPQAGQAKCEMCPVGYISTLIAQTACVTCPLGEEQALPGKSVCTKCKVGTARGSNDPATLDHFVNPYHLLCGECKPGYKAEAEGSKKCDVCPIDHETAVKGKATCDACEHGHVQTKEHESFSFVGNGRCGACKPGYYFVKGHKRSNTETVGCLACPEGQTSSPAASACQACPVNFGFDKAKPAVKCSECSEGHEAAEEKDVGQDVVKARICKKCPTGKYRGPGSFVCQGCPVGFYANAEGMTYCERCNQPSYTDQVGKSECSACAPDLYVSPSHCRKCPLNADASQAGCPECPENQHQNDQENGCVACPVNTFRAKGAANCCPVEHTWRPKRRTCRPAKEPEP